MKLTWELEIPAHLNREREISLESGQILACLGPLDFPHEVLVSREHQRVEFEFHYCAPSDEKHVTLKVGDIRVTIGQKSGRLFSLLCSSDADVGELEKPLELLNTAARVVTDRDRPHRRRAHYELIADDILPHVLEQFRRELKLEK